MGNNLLMHHYYKPMPGQQRPEEPKQYNIVCHKPLIFHTVAAFLKYVFSKYFYHILKFFCFSDRLKWIDHIVVLGPPNSLDQMEEILAPLAVRQQKRFDVIAGTATRHGSIKNGLDFIANRALSPDFVIVHDGARPYVDGDTLHRLLDEAQYAGAAGCVCKLSSTIVSTEDTAEDDKELEHERSEGVMKLGHALDRSKYWASEMPQAFRYPLIKQAYEKVKPQQCLLMFTKVFVFPPNRPPPMTSNTAPNAWILFKDMRQPRLT